MGLQIRRAGQVPAGLGPLSAAAEAAYDRHRGAGPSLPLCFAPEVSLNFFADGSVSACCLGRGEPVGRYPEQSVEEIWRGAALRSMRQLVRDRDLPLSCEVCRHQIEAGNYGGVLAANFDRFAGTAVAHSAEPVLRVLEFELSNVCNLECVMCNGWNSSLIRRNREQLAPIPELYGADFLAQLEPFLPDVREARFLGGEPFLIPFYFDLWDAFADLGTDVEISITTNGTVMNRRVHSVLDRLGPDIVVSIDSVDPATYREVRVNATLERTLENLEVFRSACEDSGASLSVSACPMVQTWRTLPDLVDFCNDRALPLVFNTVVQPTSASLQSLGPSGLESVAEHLLAEADRRAASGAVTTGVATTNVERLRGVAQQVARWARTGAPQGPERTTEQALRKELEDWCGRSALIAVLDDHSVVSVDVPDWAERLSPEAWVGQSELHLLPSLMETLGAEGVDVELTDRPGGVVQVDVTFEGPDQAPRPPALRMFRLPHLERDPTLHAVLLGCERGWPAIVDGASTAPPTGDR